MWGFCGHVTAVMMQRRIVRCLMSAVLGFFLQFELIEKCITSVITVFDIDHNSNINIGYRYWPKFVYWCISGSLGLDNHGQ